MQLVSKRRTGWSASSCLYLWPFMDFFWHHHMQMSCVRNTIKLYTHNLGVICLKYCRLNENRKLWDTITFTVVIEWIVANSLILCLNGKTEMYESSASKRKSEIRGSYLIGKLHVQTTSLNNLLILTTPLCTSMAILYIIVRCEIVPSIVRLSVSDDLTSVSPAQSNFTPESCRLLWLRSSSLRLDEFELRTEDRTVQLFPARLHQHNLEEKVNFVSSTWTTGSHTCTIPQMDTSIKHVKRIQYKSVWCSITVGCQHCR